jgi:hypothetical protein
MQTRLIFPNAAISITCEMGHTNVGDSVSLAASLSSDPFLAPYTQKKYRVAQREIRLGPPTSRKKEYGTSCEEAFQILTLAP